MFPECKLCDVQPVSCATTPQSLFAGSLAEDRTIVWLFVNDLLAVRFNRVQLNIVRHILLEVFGHPKDFFSAIDIEAHQTGMTIGPAVDVLERGAGLTGTQSLLAGLDYDDPDRTVYIYLSLLRVH